MQRPVTDAVVTYIVHLNELSVLRFMWLVAAGRRPYLVRIEPVFPQTARLLNAIAECAVGSGRAHWIVDLCPKLEPEWDYPPRALLHAIFAETEGWQNTHYGFEAADRHVPDYALAYKQLTCCHTWFRHVEILMLKSVLEEASPGSVTVIGLPDDAREMVEAYAGGGLTVPARAGRAPSRLINFATYLLNLIYGAAFALARLKPLGVRPVSVFLAADYIYDPRDMALYRELSGDDPNLLVYRVTPPDLKKFPELVDHLSCRPNAGAFSWSGLARAIIIVFADGLKLFRRFGHLSPDLFYKIAALPTRRIELRGLFAKYPPRYFLGRDPYNVEHILRRQELARIGAESLGLIAATPAYTILFPHIRYVSFDRLYVPEYRLFAEFYSDTWPRDMAITGTASHSIDARRLDERDAPRPNDIAVFTAIFVSEPGMVTLVRGLAEAFPDRRILLQVKWNFIGRDSGKRFIAACTDGLENVILTRDSVYDILRDVRYAFSDPSSLIYEAIQLGTYAFAVDVSTSQRTNIFRRVPGLAVRNADEAVNRIRDIESGARQYPTEACAEIVDFSARPTVEVIKADLDPTAPSRSRQACEPKRAARAANDRIST